jgi:hypothetical protein
MDGRVTKIGQGFWPDLPINIGQEAWLVALHKRDFEPELYALAAPWDMSA